jgi:hypothetical protein
VFSGGNNTAAYNNDVFVTGLRYTGTYTFSYGNDLNIVYTHTVNTWVHYCGTLKVAMRQRKVYVNGQHFGGDTTVATLTADGPIKIGYVGGIQALVGNRYNSI